ncbi:MAG: hypothetical protein OEZ59_02150 [Deltaproteobacteria bacterium]|nr:hypothetical protein [Deltaproteobacteria bacterium]
MHIRLLLAVRLILGLIYLAKRIWPVLRSHPRWRTVAAGLGIYLLRRGLPWLLNFLRSLRFFR